MGQYLEIFLNDKIYSQRTPNSKFIEFDLNGVKLKTYEELPLDIKKIVNKMIDMEQHPDLYFEYEEYSEGIVIKEILDETLKHIRIPEMINNIPVTGIGHMMMPTFSEIEQIHLPDTIKYLGAAAFSEAINLKYINLPESITSIPERCFYNCLNLLNIDLSNITEIGTEAFENCNSLIDVNLPNVSSLGFSTFLNCKKLKTVTIGNKLKSIYGENFKGCDELETINLSNLIEEIGRSAFEDCVKLKDINLPESLKAIESSAFYNCTSLKEISIPKDVQLLGNLSFANSGLEKIIINNNIETAFISAFHNCNKLQEIQIMNDSCNIEKMFRKLIREKIRIIDKNGKQLNSPISIEER